MRRSRKFFLGARWLFELSYLSVPGGQGIFWVNYNLKKFEFGRRSMDPLAQNASLDPCMINIMHYKFLKHWFDIIYQTGKAVLEMNKSRTRNGLYGSF